MQDSRKWRGGGGGRGGGKGDGRGASNQLFPCCVRTGSVPLLLQFVGWLACLPACCFFVVFFLFSGPLVFSFCAFRPAVETVVPELSATPIIELAASRRDTYRNNNSMVLVVETRWKLLLLMLLLLLLMLNANVEGSSCVCVFCVFLFTGANLESQKEKYVVGRPPGGVFLPMNIIDHIHHAALVLWVHATYAQLSLTSCGKGHPPFRFWGAEWEEEDGTGRNV